MILYLIKSILCSAVLHLVYRIFLDYEKMPVTKRWFLLITVFASVITPLISFNLILESAAFNASPIPLEGILYEGIPTQGQQLPSPFPWLTLLLIIWISTSVLLLIRFVLNILSLFQNAKKCVAVKYKGYHVILNPFVRSPYSFLNFIFVNQNEYEAGEIPESILLHEMAHVRQKHSIDIVLIEFILAFFWFNPVYYLIKRDMRLNHEFLADDFVIKQNTEIKSYQYLILKSSAGKQTLSLGSPFNYLFTKKRLTMMTRKIPAQRAILKQVALVPLFSLVLIFFSTNSYTQQVSKVKPEVIVEPGDGASSELLEEYDKAVEVMKTRRTLPDGKSTVFNDLGKVNKKRMAEIYSKMSEKQRMVGERNRTGEVFVNLITPPKQNPPKPEFLEELLDADKFGLWIDGKRVQNHELA